MSTQFFNFMKYNRKQAEIEEVVCKIKMVFIFLQLFF